MAELQDYSTTAGSNNSASPAGWPEGMAPSGVNNSDRELAARIARERDDVQGVTATGGSSGAYTFASARDTTAAYTGELFVVRANHTNTGAATFNVTPSGGSARGAVAIQRAGAALKGGEIISGGVYGLVYDGTQYQLVGWDRQLSRFLAYNSADDANQTGNGATATVTFDTEITDELADFASNTYTARYTGMHLLTATVNLANFGAGANTANLIIVTSNRSYRHQKYTLPTSNTGDSVTLTVVADMDAADTATVTIQVSGMAGDTVTIKSGNAPLNTMFSGAQIA